MKGDLNMAVDGVKKPVRTTTSDSTTTGKSKAKKAGGDSTKTKLAKTLSKMSLGVFDAAHSAGVAVGTKAKSIFKK